MGGVFSNEEEVDSVQDSKPIVQADDKKYVLVAGGAGYIGSHTCICLIEKGFTPVVVDNLVNSSEESLRRVQQITETEIIFENCDMATEKDVLMRICQSYKFVTSIHFAGLKAVGESVKKPMLYYRNNLVSTLNLVECLEATGCRSIIFSSSATVYGPPEQIPITEDSRAGVGVTNPYGKTKFFIEEMLTDYAKANPAWRVVLLRYFNPIGAHESGLIGEDPQGIPNNLMPYLSQVAVGRREKLSVFGDDYPTVDGTGVRDYIHVVDLANGHLAALENDILNPEKEGTSIYNLGTGRGTSVLELLHALEKACGKTLPYEVVGRREGDIASMYADPTFAEQELGWKAELSIEKACIDTWNWQSNNPQGYS